MGVARTIDGFLDGASQEALDSIDAMGQSLATLVAAAAKRFGAKPESILSATTAALKPQADEKPRKTDPAAKDRPAER